MQRLAKELAVTAEICGTEFSEPAAKAIMIRLSSYPVDDVIKALRKCQVEVTGRLSLAAIVQRIDDGRPDADEAWGIALTAMDESRTVVMNDEIAEAFGVARDVFNAGDDTGARMAFRSAYNRVVDKNRTDGNAVRWWPSLGFDKHERESALLAVVAAGRLGHSTVAGLLPPPENIEISQEVLKLSQKLMQK